MWGRIITTVFTVFLYWWIAYFLRGCYLEYRDIRIEPVNQPATWTYDMFTPILGERMYHVLIDGDLDQEARLERQYQIHHIRFKHQDTTFTAAGPYAGQYSMYPYPKYTSHTTRERDTIITYSDTLRLPKGKFSTYLYGDDSGAETYIYHPYKATKGWVRIQLKPEPWDSRDSSRQSPEWLPASK
ncbi:hypothetical protein GCM10027592_28380 [Spirosoma flavus]